MVKFATTNTTIGDIMDALKAWNKKSVTIEVRGVTGTIAKLKIMKV